MPPKKDYGEPSRRSERLKTTTTGVFTKDQAQDSVQVQDQDLRSDTDSHFDTDPGRQLIDEMAEEENNQRGSLPGELELLRQRIAELEAERENRSQRSGSAEANRFGREITVETSAFGGSSFRATGMAAWPIFKMFDGEDGVNPKYDRKEKSRADNPPKFSGDKRLFDN